MQIFSLTNLLLQSWATDGNQFVTLDVNQNLRVWDVNSPKMKDHLQRANKELPTLNQYTDYVLLQHFTKHSLFQVCNYADSAKHFGANNLIMLKSPINGICVVELLCGSQVKHVHAEAKDSYLVDNES